MNPKLNACLDISCSCGLTHPGNSSNPIGWIIELNSNRKGSQGFGLMLHNILMLMQSLFSLAWVNFMVRLQFSFNKFLGPLVLKTSRAIILFPHFVLNTTPGTSVGEISQDHHCHTHARSPTDVSHNIVCTNLTREKGKDTRVSRLPSGLAESPLPWSPSYSRVMVCASTTSQLSLIHEFERILNLTH